MTTFQIALICIALLLCAAAVAAGVTHRTFHPRAPTPLPGKKKIACIGDSITYGAGVALHHHSQSWPAYLQALVPDGWQTLNYGLSNRTLLKAGDSPFGKEPFFPLSHEVKADIYIIMLGTNDSKPVNWRNAGTRGENYEKELTDFVCSYQALPSNPVIFLMQPPRAFSSKYTIDEEIIRTTIHEAVARVAQKTGCGLIDLYAFTQSHPDWFPDGIHPNAEGNRQIAQFIFDQIQINNQEGYKHERL